MPSAENNNELEPRIVRAWQDLYIEMLSDPFDNRTDKKFSEDMNIAAHTLSAWKGKNRKQIFEEVSKRRKLYTNELRVRTHKALASKLDKDTNAIKLALQILGELVERSEVKTETMTQEDKKRRIEAMLQNISTKKKAWDANEKDVQAPGQDSKA